MLDIHQTRNRGCARARRQRRTAQRPLPHRHQSQRRQSTTRTRQATTSLANLIAQVRSGDVPISSPAHAWKFASTIAETDFDAAWDWMGDIASWRSATQAELFPEAALHPPSSSTSAAPLHRNTPQRRMGHCSTPSQFRRHHPGHGRQRGRGLRRHTDSDPETIAYPGEHHTTRHPHLPRQPRPQPPECA